MVVKTSHPFGSRSRSQVLMGLHLLEESHARELSRMLGIPLYSVQQALRSLERDGLVGARAVGRTRAYRIEPRYFARRELTAYLAKLCEADAVLERRVEGLRRRPRRAGKPL